MQEHSTSPPQPPHREGETTLKVSRTIHGEMISEFTRLGFPTLAHYTDFILRNRQRIIEANAATAPVQPPTPTAHELGSVPDAAQPWQQVHQPQKQPGIFISNEDYYVLKSNQEAFQKEREERGRLAHTVQSLSDAIDALVDEAAACSGSILKNYNKAYFEQIVFQILKKEGIQV